MALYACMYFAALRPGEAVALRRQDCYLPASGWGRLTLEKSRPEVNQRWNDTASAHDERGLKHRSVSETRRVPIPPELVAILRQHIDTFGIPADGRIFVLPSVDPQRCFCIKGGQFVLRDFLANAELTRRFAGGAMAIVRLHLADYHHFHFPVSGVPLAPWLIGHRLHAVGPYARRWPVPFFSENRRMLTLIRTPHCGLTGMAEIGACTVGSIRQTFRPAEPVDKGARKGYFETGGSTIVLLFPPGAMRFDDDLCAHSASGTETYVRMGERIGTCQRGSYEERYAHSI